MNISFAIDHAYVRYCAATMASVLENNKDMHTVFHVVGNGLSGSDKSALSGLAGRYGAEAKFYEVPSEMMDGYKVRWGGKRLSMAVFYRLALASLLPGDVGRTLYLDCDVIVNKPIRSFYAMPMEGIAVAAAQDMLKPVPEFFERLGYDISEGYFNAGVALLNLDYWRENDVEQRLKSHYAANSERMERNDQDLMNAVLHAEKKMVSLKWNAQDEFFRLCHYADPEERAICLKAVRDPAIIHFSYKEKPWLYDCCHPLRHLFAKYQSLTPFNDWKRIESPANRLHRFVHLLPYSLGMKPWKYITSEQLDRLLTNEPASTL